LVHSRQNWKFFSSDDSLTLIEEVLGLNLSRDTDSFKIRVVFLSDFRKNPECPLQLSHVHFGCISTVHFLRSCTPVVVSLEVSLIC
jgi:hypothetical protein